MRACSVLAASAATAATAAAAAAAAAAGGGVLLVPLLSTVGGFQFIEVSAQHSMTWQQLTALYSNTFICCVGASHSECVLRRIRGP
jgi:hypothetical protein